jgi:hypothetical protein
MSNSLISLATRGIDDVAQIAPTYGVIRLCKTSTLNLKIITFPNNTPFLLAGNDSICSY